MTQQRREEERVLDALGNATRREILNMLKSNPMPVGAIADRLPISRPAVSKHLHELQAGGLVDFRPQGTRNIFRLRVEGFVLARQYLESFWDEALENFMRVAEEEREVDR